MEKEEEKEEEVLKEEKNNILNQKEKEENKLMDSGYKSEGEEEYTMKKMINATKKRNQSEDIKIDYPGLSNMKQKYDELEQKYRKLEEIIFDLLSKLKCTGERPKTSTNIKIKPIQKVSSMNFPSSNKNKTKYIIH